MAAVVRFLWPITHCATKQNKNNHCTMNYLRKTETNLYALWLAYLGKSQNIKPQTTNRASNRQACWLVVSLPTC
eukprot:3219069-Amphidinium_carterae.1